MSSSFFSMAEATSEWPLRRARRTPISACAVAACPHPHPDGWP
eukprot:CAMPEP_0203847270 /NCGR_PEP_ID=MMETSP0359-20131031/4921_1 /ASSEMBLY_ACC=CAM_ASM_000338 /TAXON_ID=268821 /ORGANISM="Scrippsiella Hangoei, Strain SHTV-5" /LENGTH=42 /DNA_ID= /DNA_START= /DNA_END= /DNA_ORIENTATION=